MPRTYLKDYITTTPTAIYYDYTDSTYTATQPDNTHDYDVYERVNSERQTAYDKEPWNRKFYKDNPRDLSTYINPYADEHDETKTLCLYWNDWRSALHESVKDGKTINTDLALNLVL